MKTYADAINAGYIHNGTAYQRGYVSRKITDYSSRPLMTAGGTRKGELYITIPCNSSTQYCLRLYLAKA